MFVNITVPCPITRGRYRANSAKEEEEDKLREDVEDRCRMCNSGGESIEHVIAGCPVLAGSAYLDRHNDVFKIVHQQLALRYKLVEHILTLLPISPRSSPGK